MTLEQKIDKIMQSGLQFRFFNKPVKDDQMWDIKIFWIHVDVRTSEGFDSCEDCINDCLKYLENFKNDEI